MKHLRCVLLAVIVAVFCLSPLAFAAEKYCLVENGQIVYGPKKIPRSWRNISGLHLLGDAELKPLGWLPYDTGTPPAYNEATQYFSFVNVAGENSVTRSYTIVNYTQEELDVIAAEAARVQKITDAEEVMTLSSVANISYAQLDNYVETTFSGLPPAQLTALKRLFKVVLAGLKRHDWSE